MIRLTAAQVAVLVPTAAPLLAAVAGRVRDTKVKKTRVPHPEHASGFITQLRALQLPIPSREFQFARPARRYAADLYFPTLTLLVDIDGGSWLPAGKGKSHTSGRQFERDRRKDLLALALGYRTCRLTPAMIADGTAVDLIARLAGRPLAHSPLTRTCAKVEPV